MKPHTHTVHKSLF